MFGVCIPSPYRFPTIRVHLRIHYKQILHSTGWRQKCCKSSGAKRNALQDHFHPFKIDIQTRNFPFNSQIHGLVQDGRDQKIIMKDSIKKSYLIITHYSKTIQRRFTRFRTIGVDGIARVCCKSQFYVDPSDFCGRSKSALLLLPLPFHGNPVFQVSSVQLRF